MSFTKPCEQSLGDVPHAKVLYRVRVPPLPPHRRTCQAVPRGPHAARTSRA